MTPAMLSVAQTAAGRRSRGTMLLRARAPPPQHISRDAQAELVD